MRSLPRNSYGLIWPTPLSQTLRSHPSSPSPPDGRGCSIALTHAPAGTFFFFFSFLPARGERGFLFLFLSPSLLGLSRGHCSKPRGARILQAPPPGPVATPHGARSLRHPEAPVATCVPAHTDTENPPPGLRARLLRGGAGCGVAAAQGPITRHR